MLEEGLVALVSLFRLVRLGKQKNTFPGFSLAFLQ